MLSKASCKRANGTSNLTSFLAILSLWFPFFTVKKDLSKTRTQGFCTETKLIIGATEKKSNYSMQR